ncbi:MAG: MXAN_2562 family outer membrane beta-barrel protein [Myxococcaceae bacterium]
MKHPFWVSALCVCALSGAARADVVDVGLGHSPRVGMFEIKLGSYKPSMAGSAGEAYSIAFKDQPMLLVQLEFDYQFFQKYGSLGLGISVGYAEKYGQTFLVSDPSKPADERVHLKIVPLALMAVYRLDYGAIHWGIPVVPYTKFGVAMVPWWSGTSTAQVSNTRTGQRQAGHPFGLTFTAGLSLLLDVLDPRLARDFDTDVGINHTYLFAEFNRLNNRLFNKDGYDFSSGYFMFGLALEF